MTASNRTDVNSKFAPGKLTPDKKRKALALRAKGWPGYAIAQHVGVSPNAIYRFLRLDAEQSATVER